MQDNSFDGELARLMRANYMECIGEAVGEGTEVQSQYPCKTSSSKGDKEKQWVMVMADDLLGTNWLRAGRFHSWTTTEWEVARGWCERRQWGGEEPHSNMNTFNG